MKIQHVEDISLFFNFLFMTFHLLPAARRVRKCFFCLSCVLLLRQLIPSCGGKKNKLRGNIFQNQCPVSPNGASGPCPMNSSVLRATPTISVSRPRTLLHRRSLSAYPRCKFLVRPEDQSTPPPPTPEAPGGGLRHPAM